MNNFVEFKSVKLTCNLCLKKSDLLFIETSGFAIFSSGTLAVKSQFFPDNWCSLREGSVDYRKTLCPHCAQNYQIKFSIHDKKVYRIEFNDQEITIHRDKIQLSRPGKEIKQIPYFPRLESIKSILELIKNYP